jgi:hypothetical protein
VAVPISDETDWQSFVDTIRLKLKLSGVGDMYLASTGELVQRLDQLQDIDEVQVVEVGVLFLLVEYLRRDETNLEENLTTMENVQACLL